MIFDPNFKSSADWIQLQDLWRKRIRDVYRSVASNGHVIAEVRFAGEWCVYLAIARRQIEAQKVTPRRRTWASDAQIRHIIRTDPQGV